MRLLAAGLLSVALAAQSYPPAFPRTNATKLLETERMVVWDIVWPKGQPTPLHRHVYDQVGTYYQAGGRVITSLDGSKRETTTAVGALSRTRKGTTHVEEGATDPPLRAVFIELKSDTGSGLPSPADAAAMFPRPGATELLDDERVSVWDYTWSPTDASVSGRHGREIVWVWLAGGTVDITPPGGSPARTKVAPGQIRHLARGTVESVRAVEGLPRAMIFAFK